MASPLILRPGLLALYSPDIKAGSHSHSAVQIIWPEAGHGWEINGESGAGAVVIGPGASHSLSLQAGWVILLERQSAAGNKACDYLGDKSLCALPALADYRVSASADQLAQLVPVWSALGLDGLQLFRQQVSDSRLKHLVSKLDTCLQHSCIKPAQWRASDVAAELALSPSRFLHLFREQMDIAWRPYLLWRRLLCAVHELSKGRSATDAAVTAGFADSAHLSRTFRSTFGMSVRDAVTHFG